MWVELGFLILGLAYSDSSIDTAQSEHVANEKEISCKVCQPRPSI